MKLDQTYSANDIERIYLYPNGKSHRTNTKEWNTNIYLPKGWKCKDKRKGATNIILRAAEGITLTSSRAASAFMEQNTACTNEDIKQLYFYPDGENQHFTFIYEPIWRTNRYLPQGWSYCKKKGRSGQKQRMIIKSDIGFEMIYQHPDGISHRQRKEAT